MEARGFSVTATYAGEVLSNVAGGIDEGTTYGGLLRVDLELDTAKARAWEGGTVHVSGLYPHGRSLTAHYLGDLFTFSNIDAAPEPRLFELWYQHELIPDRLSIRLGQLAPDEEFAGTEYGAAFINSTCGWPVFLGANVPSAAYPTGSAGVRVAWQPAADWTLRVGVYNGDPYPIDDAGDPLDPHGTRFSAWRDAFAIAELERTWNRGSDDTGLPGRASVGGWYHSGLFEHQRLDTSGGCRSLPTSTGIPLLCRGNGGGFLTAEQQVARTREDGAGPGVFVRLGGAPSSHNPIEGYVEVGGVWPGLVPGRAEDILGIAFVHAQMSQDARGLVRSAAIQGTSNQPLPDYERILEVTYTAILRPGLTAQPVLGWVQHPGGCPGHDALVLGLRVTLDF